MYIFVVQPAPVKIFAKPSEIAVLSSIKAAGTRW